MKKGCGTKKMAKGGAVKVSPRKAMAMGKKPAGVKKYAAGGAVMAPQQKRKTGLGFIQEPPKAPAGVPARLPISSRAIPNATSMSSVQAAPGNPNTFRSGAIQVKKYAAGGAVMAPQQKRKTGLGFIKEPPIRSTGLPARPAVVGRGTGTMTQQGMQQARQVDKITSPPSSLPPPAGTRKELGQYLTPPPVRRFKKGGSVKKGGK